MDDDPDGFESHSLRRTSQDHGDEPSSNGTKSHVNEYASEHGSDKESQTNEKSIRKDELNEKQSTISFHGRENGDQTGNQSKRTKDVPSYEQRKNRQHNTGAIKRDVYDDIGTTKEHTQCGNVLTWVCGSDHIDDIAIDVSLVDSLLKLKSLLTIKDGWAEKAIVNFLVPNLETYDKESLKEICSLFLKGDCHDVFNCQAPASTIVMTVNTGDKEFAASKGKNFSGKIQC